MQKLTTTIRREPFEEIADGSKKIEYREIKDYWEKKLANYEVPFHLRLINGMRKNAPELIVEVVRIRRNNRHGQFELHLGQIVEIKNSKVPPKAKKSKLPKIALNPLAFSPLFNLRFTQRH